MDTSPPLVCASLHLPPDLQPFQRIYEVSWHVFAPNLDRLRLAVEEIHDCSPEATEIFWKTRNVLRTELIKAFKILQSGTEVARRYSLVLKALEDGKPAQEALNVVRMHAQMGMRVSTESQEAFSACRKELEKAIDRVTAVTDAPDKNISGSSLTSSQNVQLVTEIFSAIDECNGLLQQCHDQFSRLAKRIRHEHSIDSDPPSDEEIQVMRAKWQTFFDTAEGLWKLSADIAEGVVFESSDIPDNSSGSRKARERERVPLWRSLFQREAARDLIRVRNVTEAPSAPTDPSAAREISTNAVNQVDATQRLQAPESRTVPDTALPNTLNTSKTKVPFWRKVLQRTSYSSRNVSERVEASRDAPDTTTTPPRIPFWRKLFPWTTCVSKTPLR